MEEEYVIWVVGLSVVIGSVEISPSELEDISKTSEEETEEPCKVALEATVMTV